MMMNLSWYESMKDITIGIRSNKIVSVCFPNNRYTIGDDLRNSTSQFSITNVIGKQTMQLKVDAAIEGKSEVKDINDTLNSICELFDPTTLSYLHIGIVLDVVHVIGYEHGVEANFIKDGKAQIPEDWLMFSNQGRVDRRRIIQESLLAPCEIHPDADRVLVAPPTPDMIFHLDEIKYYSTKLNIGTEHLRPLAILQELDPIPRWCYRPWKCLAVKLVSTHNDSFVWFLVDIEQQAKKRKERCKNRRGDLADPGKTDDQQHRQQQQYQ